MIPTVLIIEDEAALCAALETALRRVGCAVETAASGKAALQRLKSKSYAAAVLDIGLPDMSGLKVLKELRAKDPHLPVLVITAHGHLENAIAARTAGATEYLVKPLDLRHFQQTVRSLLENQSTQATQTPSPNQKPYLFVGGAPVLQTAFSGIARACAGDGPVLVTGPSGSGKSLVASIIHAQSSRSASPLETLAARELNCSTLEGVLTKDPRGTILLTEITNLPHECQILLSQRLGITRQTRCRRIIATTSHDLREAATTGLFREDLYYLLSVSEVPLPPLSERSSDIPALVASLLSRTSGTAPEITPSALATLQGHDWPGNVRELHHVLDYACSASRGRPILLSHLPAHISAKGSPSTPPAHALEKSIHGWLSEILASDSDFTYDLLLEILEKNLLQQLLPRYDHKPTRLATALKVHRTTLRQKMLRLGLKGDFGS